MNDPNEKIKAMLGRPYGAELKGQSKQFVCWHFCREVYRLFGRKLNLQHQTQLGRLDGPAVPCIVLFRAAMDWHSGVVWPDGLHFVHAATKNIFHPQDEQYVVYKERLTAWPYRTLIEGYYTGGSSTE